MNAPKIDNCPGIKWRKLKHGWQARWRARTDLVARGYPLKEMRLFDPTPDMPEPDETTKAIIASRCQGLQDEMIVWASGGIPFTGEFDGTWSSLIRCYKNDPDSSYREKRPDTRKHYDTLCKRLERDAGGDLVEDTHARKMKRLYEGWSEGGKVAMGHAMIGMMRTLATFGATILTDKACRELKTVLHDMRFKGSKPRESVLTAEMATAVRTAARARDRASIALAQAFQFDLMLRQRDVIGEWVPISEPGPVTDVIDGNNKWLRGIRGEEIDDNLILRHVTSKRNKLIVVDLKLAPMVMEEYRIAAGLGAHEAVTRAHIPAKGPLIVCETGARPWTNIGFRRAWRVLARECGIPDDVRNMDSRAGAISEATDAGADLEHVRHAATHSDIGMTQRYSRGSEDKVAGVMKMRAEHRNKSGTKEQ